MAPTAFIPTASISRRRFREADGTLIPNVWKTNEYRIAKPTWRRMLQEKPEREPYTGPWRAKLTLAMERPGPSDEDTLNAVMDWQTDNMRCQICGARCKDAGCGQACYQAWRSAGPMARLENECEIRPLFYRNKIGGHGLFLKADVPASIQRHELIGEYVGEVIPADADEDNATATSTYVFDVKGFFHVDAAGWGNETRFINHHCDPNLKAAVVIVGGRRIVSFRALRAIRAGDELTINYGVEYFEGEMCYCNVNGGVVAHPPRPRV
ncbi:hypothetical protein PG993_000073 [Apiospora rasikravindrae]|uniref:SET domain-containing protein n=1 Tax=Apiospora rasikravindrae TaxID=990691 RepID=A0ABR1U9K7_9PEZI